ncbi:MAG: ATP-binding protein [Lachnospiraceae bacterium]|nr:ATP-binding protein [Lachnospiraceae bacterium]
MKEITLDAKKEKLGEVLDFIGSELDRISCPMKTRIQIEVAVEEIFINIATYAYPPESGKVTVKLDLEEDSTMCLTISFEDSGVPYDPLAKEDPDITLSAEERPIGGLGIFMVKKSMDDMDYEFRDGRNILTIRKYIGQK